MMHRSIQFRLWDAGSQEEPEEPIASSPAPDSPEIPPPNYRYELVMVEEDEDAVIANDDETDEPLDESVDTEQSSEFFLFKPYFLFPYSGSYIKVHPTRFG